MDRKYEIDWLRIILIFSVFLYHSGMIFNEWGWHIKDGEKQAWLSPIMHFLHLWRMPLLFFISGAGTYYAKRKRSNTMFAGERIKRLFFPLLIGIFTLVPIQVFYERINEYGTLWNYYPHMFDGIYPAGNFSWHHLWFICYLFIVSMLMLIFFQFEKTNIYKFIRKSLKKIADTKIFFMLFMMPLILSELLLRPHFPKNTHALIDDWAYLSFNFIVFLYGYLFMSSNTINKKIFNERKLNLIIFITATILYHTIDRNNKVLDILSGISQLGIIWFGILTSVGFANRYLNFNNNWRGKLNEAIYPFYLLHQPVLIAIAYYILKLNLPTGIEALAIIIVSFIVSVGVYTLIIKRINILRIMFGMKPVNRLTLKLRFSFNKG